MSENKASTGLVIKLVLTGLVTGLIVPLTAAIWLFFKHKQVDVTLFFNQELMPVFVATPFITAFVGFISAIGVQKQFKRIFNLLSRQKQIVQSVTVFAEKIGTVETSNPARPEEISCSALVISIQGPIISSAA